MTRHAIRPPQPVVAPTLPDLARAASSLLDRYGAAVETVLRCAHAGSRAPESLEEATSLRLQIARALGAVADASAGDIAERWYVRAGCATYGIIDADAWSCELLQIAGATEASETEPAPPLDEDDGAPPC